MMSLITKKRFCNIIKPKSVYTFHKKKSILLKEMLYAKNKVFHMMEAHNGLSAKIVEKVGFPAIWGSGLSISAQYGVRDANEISWTQVVDSIDFINQACSIPVLLDGDTGFGNYNNARRLVNKLESIGIAGVCIEDKLFPKTNSFIEKNKPQELADIYEFSLKIRACKDAQKDPDFNVVARVEALIAGYGIEEAVKRADAYYKAGADAILIHSKQKTGKEIREFLKIWNKRHPIIIVPTKFANDITADEMREMGVNLIIWANHNIRSSVKAIKETSTKIWRSKHCGVVEPDIATVDDIFKLTNEKALENDDKIYLPEEKYEEEHHHNVYKKHDVNVHFPEPNTKLNPINFVEILNNNNIKYVSGVPDSLLDNFVEHLPVSDTRNSTIFHQIAANEGAALALAAGYQVGSGSNEPCLVYLQNSGLGNLINPLLSLTHNKVYAIPLVILIGWRGEPGNYQVKDEPQHNVQGKYMLEMFRSMEMDYFILSTASDKEADRILSEAIEHSKLIKQPVFVVVRANSFEKIKVERKNNAVIGDQLLSRKEAIEAAHYLTQNWKARVSTTGKLSRELYEVTTKNGSACKDFLMVGSMGHVFSFTAGICQAGVRGNIVCFDGDGSILMHTGSLSAIHSLPPRTKLFHLAFNNFMHESVGCQPTAFSHQTLSLSGIAQSFGYGKVFKIKTQSELEKIIKEFELLEESETHPIVWFIEWELARSPSLNEKLSRPKELPAERKELFIKSLL